MFFWGRPQWSIAAASKKSAQDAKIRAAVAVLGRAVDAPPADDLPYLSASARQITENISRRAPGWTALRVMEAYVRAAIRSQDALNCLTEIMFATALESARQLDKEFAVTGRLKGPLHGVPISIKDQFFIAGEDATIGFTHLGGKPVPSTAPLVGLIIEAGAIPFTKTNVPQTMLAFECANPLFGTTSNPYNPRFTPGGSSGGEAALIASDGSPLGIGSDIGGSVRIPSHFSGCYGLKPCSGRFIGWGSRSGSPGFESVKVSAGPMGRCVDDLEHATEVLLGMHEKLWRRFNLNPIPWRNVVMKPTLKFGYYLNDEVAKASPACQRAVTETVSALRKQGHECVKIDIARLDVLGAMELFAAFSSADGYRTLLSGLQGDPREPALFLTTLGPRLPWFLRSFAGWAAQWLAGDEVISRALMVSREKTVGELMAWQARREIYNEKVRGYLWDELGLDGVLCPPSSMPAVPKGSTWKRSMIAVATFIWNVCDSTVGVIPVTHVKETDTITEAWESQPIRSPLIHKNLYGSGGYGIYDPSQPDEVKNQGKGMAGLPIGVQLVGAQWEEEKVLKMMRVVEEALKADPAREKEKKFGPGEFALRQQAGEHMWE